MGSYQIQIEALIRGVERSIDKKGKGLSLKQKKVNLSEGKRAFIRKKMGSLFRG